MRRPQRTLYTTATQTSPEDIYHRTTNPEHSYAVLLSFSVLLSIILHTLLYLFGLWVIHWVLFGELATVELIARVGGFLLVIMPLGYIGRLQRAKRLYAHHSMERVREIMDHSYICWYFIG